MTNLGDVAVITDCEHKTATACAPNERYAWSVGTKAIRSGRIVYDQSRAVDVSTYEQFTARRVPAHGDLILAREAPVGDCVIVPKDQRVCLGQRTVLLSADAALLNHRYLYFLLHAPQAQAWMELHSAGSTVKHLNVKDIYQIPLGILPPLEEQERIVGVLGAFDDLIETNRRLAADILELTRDVYARAVARATARIPLGTVAVANPEKRTPGDPGATLRYLDIGTMTDGSVGEPTSTTWSEAPSRARRGAALGDVLWATVRPNRRAHGLLTRDIENLVVSTGVAVLRPTRLPMSLIFAHTDSQRFVEALVGRVDGSAYPAVKAADFLAVHVPDVSKEDIDTFRHVIDPLWLAAGQLEEEAISLTRQRDELLPLLMSGRVRVRDLEAVA
ncbi:restriction endonuclease subunit S [Micropruina sp.]|uniref:restriction endonuclease subunit S n=1 Tax=Micropruina sp. TaxID=2737536 RepID=UPI0039E3359E